MDKPLKPPMEIPSLEPARTSSPRSRGGFLLSFLLVILAVAGVVWWAQHQSAPQQSPGGGRSGSAPMSIVPETVGKGDIGINLNALGTVTSLATVTIRARVSGQIVSVAFQEGTRVKAGDLLVQIDPRPFKIALEQAVATYNRDVATLRNNERDLVRYKDLVGQKLIPQQQYDAQVATVESAKATVALDKAAADNARLNLQFSSVTSPINGLAGVRQVDLGNLVTPTDTNGIVVLTQMDPISVLFTLPQDDLPRVTAAFAKGTLTVEAWDRSGLGKLGEGKLTVIDNQVNPGTATIRLRAEFPNPDYRLWPSLFVKARMHLQTLQNVVVVATPGIQRGPNGTFVYVVNPDNTVAVRNVQVDTVQGPLAVIAQGVQAGDRVVVDGQNQLRVGAKVDPRPVPLSTSESPQPAGEATPVTPQPQAAQPGPPAQGAAAPQQTGTRAQPRQQQPQGRTGQSGGPREASAQ